jgi:hypothetical protein
MYKNLPLSVDHQRWTLLKLIPPNALELHQYYQYPAINRSQNWPLPSRLKEALAFPLNSVPATRNYVSLNPTNYQPNTAIISYTAIQSKAYAKSVLIEYCPNVCHAMPIQSSQAATSSG